jgi:3-oxoacyl-[acyl-carrier-protein] synthase-3
MSQYSSIVGTGVCLPKRVVSNSELTAILADQGVETSAEWIQTRTGIEQRYFVSDGESCSYMAKEAALQALLNANAKPSDVDAIIVATSTPDQVFPSVACTVQAAIGAHRAFAFDLQAACSGFVYGLTLADSMIRSGQIRSALVIGSEVFSRLVDWKDRSTCVLFGDGAGAVYVSASEEPGILGCSLFADGVQGDVLAAACHVENGRIVGDPFLRMDGQAVFKQAVSVLGSSALDLLGRLGLTVTDLDFLVPHQANIRILQSVAKKLNLPEDRVVVTVNRYGNTSAASVPLALHHALNAQLIKKGNTVLLQGVGAGFTWGSVLLRV